MKKYLIRFTTKDGDYNNVSMCYADSEDEAAQITQDEHWNIAHIDMVSEL